MVPCTGVHDTSFTGRGVGCLPKAVPMVSLRNINLPTSGLPRLGETGVQEVAPPTPSEKPGKGRMVSRIGGWLSRSRPHACTLIQHREPGNSRSQSGVGSGARAGLTVRPQEGSGLLRDEIRRRVNRRVRPLGRADPTSLGHLPEHVTHPHRKPREAPPPFRN